MQFLTLLWAAALLHLVVNAGSSISRSQHRKNRIVAQQEPPIDQEGQALIRDLMQKINDKDQVLAERFLLAIRRRVMYKHEFETAARGAITDALEAAVKNDLGPLVQRIMNPRFYLWNDGQNGGDGLAAAQVFGKRIKERLANGQGDEPDESDVPPEWEMPLMVHSLCPALEQLHHTSDPFEMMYALKPHQDKLDPSVPDTPTDCYDKLWLDTVTENNEHVMRALVWFPEVSKFNRYLHLSYDGFKRAFLKMAENDNVNFIKITFHSFSLMMLDRDILTEALMVAEDNDAFEVQEFLRREVHKRDQLFKNPVLRAEVARNPHQSHLLHRWIHKRALTDSMRVDTDFQVFLRFQDAAKLNRLDTLNAALGEVVRRRREYQDDPFMGFFPFETVYAYWAAVRQAVRLSNPQVLNRLLHLQANEDFLDDEAIEETCIYLRWHVDVKSPRSIEIVKAFLLNDPAVVCNDAASFTFYRAVSVENIDLIRFMVNLSPDLWSTDLSDPISHAAENDNVEMFDAAVSGNFKPTDEIIETAIETAIKFKSRRVLHRLQDYKNRPSQ